MRVPGGGVRAVPLSGLPSRSTGPVLLQGARILSEPRRSPHDGSSGPLGINLILYHGVLAPRAEWRRAVVPARGDAHELQGCDTCAGGTDGTPSQRLPNRTWAELMPRSFPPPPRLRRASGFDVLACPRCEGRLKLVALIQDGAVRGLRTPFGRTWKRRRECSSALRASSHRSIRRAA